MQQCVAAASLVGLLCIIYTPWHIVMYSIGGPTNFDRITTLPTEYSDVLVGLSARITTLPTALRDVLG